MSSSEERARSAVVGLVGADVRDEIDDHAVSVADRSLEAHWILNEVEKLLDTLGAISISAAISSHGGIVIELLAEQTSCLRHLPHLIGDMDG